MTTKSDFAQKLLHDLRLRKEKMAAAQNSSRQSSQTSRGEVLADFLFSRDSRNISVLGTNRKSMTNNAAPVRESKLQHTLLDFTGDHEESTEIHDLSQHGSKQLLILERQELTEPMSFLHAGEYNKEATETKLVLESAHEVMKRKARRLEVSHHPYMKTTISSTRVRSLDDLVKQLCKDLKMLKFYGMNGGDECDVAAGLHKMLDNDIYDKNPDVNSMWDFEWSKMRSVFPEMEDVVKDVEKHMLNGLLDEITTDFLLITVSA